MAPPLATLALRGLGSDGGGGGVLRGIRGDLIGVEDLVATRYGEPSEVPVRLGSRGLGAAHASSV